MENDPVRLVKDRWEWGSLAASTPALYHRWEWAEQSRRRVARHVIREEVSIAYLRVWFDSDTLLACPMLQIGDVWFNAPRAEPEILKGDWVEPFDVLDFAVEHSDIEIEVVDDGLQLLELDLIMDRLRGESDDWRRRRALIESDIAKMKRRLSWETEDSEDVWFEAVDWIWRSGLDTRLVEYRADGDILGWSIDVHHKGIVTHVTAGHVDVPVPEWTSPR